MQICQAFDLAVEEGRYYYAYRLLKQHPQLREQKSYQKLESIYTQAFQQAKELLESKKRNLAEELLEPFISIPQKRSSILLLLKHEKERQAFMRAYQAANYKEAYMLAQELPLLQKLPPYQEIVNFYKTLLSKSFEKLYRLELDDMLTQLEKLEGITEYEVHYNELKKAYRDAVELQKRYKNNDFVGCYELIDTSAMLTQNFELVVLLEKHWKRVYAHAHTFALLGSFYELKAALGDLWRVQTRTQSLRELFCTSFHKKIIQLLESGEFTALQNFFYTYLETFGHDSTIDELIARYEQKSAQKLAILHDYIEPHHDAWRESTLFNSE